MSNTCNWGGKQYERQHVTRVYNNADYCRGSYETQACKAKGTTPAKGNKKQLKGCLIVSVVIVVFYLVAALIGSISLVVSHDSA